MSRESLGRFYAEFLGDAALQQTLRAEMDRDTFASVVVAAGKERGFHFTEAEVNAEIARLPAAELSEGQLESLAGGVMGAPGPRTAY